MPIQVFIRHAKTKVNPNTHPSTWYLSEEGTMQNKNLLDKYDWSTLENAEIYVSTERKTKLTIESIASEFDFKITESDLLDELHINEFVSEEYFLKVRKRQFLDPNYHHNNLESSHEALQRIISFMENLPKHHDSIISSHGTILSLYFGHLLGYQGEELFEKWKNLEFGAIGVVKDGEIVKSIFDR